MPTLCPRAMRGIAVFVLAGCALSRAEHARGAIEFRGLGLIAGDQTTAVGLSSDGSVVIGNAQMRGQVWAGSAAPVAIPTLGTAYSSSGTYGISGNGLVVAGASTRQSTSRENAIYWSAATGTVALPTFAGTYQSRTHAASFDGSVLVGYNDINNSSGTYRRSFRWSSSTGLQDIGAIGGSVTGETTAFGVDASGNVVVGSTKAIASSGAPNAFRWTPLGGMQILGNLPGTTGASANGTSPDGSFVVGSSGNRPFRWTNATGMEDLGLPGPAFTSAAEYAVSNGGTTVVGAGFIPGIGQRATLWRTEIGMVDLNMYLPLNGIDLSGWLLVSAAGVSADGLTICGSGLHNGVGEGWIVVLPGPSTASALAMLLVTTGWRRRRPRV